MTSLSAILTTGLGLTLLIVLGEMIRYGLLPRPSKDPAIKEGLATHIVGSFVVGTVTYTWIELLLSTFGTRTDSWHILLLTFTATLITILRSRRSSKERPELRPLSRGEIILISLLGGLCVLNYGLAAAFPQFDIDMVAHILMKGKILGHETYRNAILLRDPVFANVHANYPPLTVFLNNLIMIFTQNEISGYLFSNIVFLFMTALVLNDMLADRLPLWLRALWMFIFLATPELLGNQYILSSSDILMALIVLLTVRQLLMTDKGSGYEHALMFAIYLSAALLTKNDALIVTLIMGLIFLVRAGKKGWSALGMIILLIGPWIMIRHGIPDPVSGGENTLRGLTWGKVAPYLKITLLTAGRTLLRSWNALFVLSIPALIIIRRDRPQTTTLLIILIGTVLGYLTMMSVIMPFFSSTPNTFLRVLIHVYPVATFTCALASVKLINPGTNAHKPPYRS